MAFVNTKVVIDMTAPDLMADSAILHREGYEYAGPVALCKKGRETVDAAAKSSAKIGDAALQTAGENKGIQSGYRAQGDQFSSNLMSTKPGELSPYAKAQYASDVDNIGKTYGSARQVGLKTLGSRGFGSVAPGMEASIINTAGEHQGEAETGAYRNAQASTLGQGLEGLRYVQGQQEVYDPNKSYGTALGGYGQQGQLGAARNKMGSWVSDLGSGISALRDWYAPKDSNG